MSITPYTNEILNANYGDDVRDSIVNALNECYKDATGNNNSIASLVQQYIDRDDAVGAVVSALTGLYGEVGEVVSDAPSSVSVNTSTYVNLASVTLTKGIWIATYCCEIAANATGHRMLQFRSQAASPPAGVARTDMKTSNVSSAVNTTLTNSVVIDVQETSAYNLYGWQNSGSTLTFWPVVQAVKIKGEELEEGNPLYNQLVSNSQAIQTLQTKQSTDSAAISSLQVRHLNDMRNMEEDLAGNVSILSSRIADLENADRVITGDVDGMQEIVQYINGRRFILDENGYLQIQNSIEYVTPEEQAKIEEVVTDWLDEHPEATTTVEDHSLTYEKLVVGTFGYVTPEMFGAVGDGVTDDTEAIQSAISYAVNNHIGSVLFRKTTYLKESDSIYIDGNNLILDGNGATIVNGESSGFIITDDSFNIVIKNFNSSCEYIKDSQEETNVHIGINADSSSPNNEFYAYNITIENCNFTGGVMGISASSAKGVSISNCQFEDLVYKPEDAAGGYGILLQSCVDVNIKFCNFSSGSYGRHGIYVSVDQRKTENKKCKNITVSSCKFDHSELELDENDHYYSPNTAPINVRTSSGIVVENSYFYSTTGAISYNSIDGVVDRVLFVNNTIDSPVLNSGSTELKYAVNFIGYSAQYYVSGTVSGVCLINVPDEYRTFMSLTNAVVDVHGCHINKTCFVCNQNVTVHLSDIVTEFTSYFIRFNGGDKTKGGCKNITFLNNVNTKYYFSSNSSCSSDFYEDTLIVIPLASSAAFTEWVALPNGMPYDKCYCSGLGTTHSTGKRYGQGTNSTNVRLFVEISENGVRAYNSDSQYFSSNLSVIISPIPE